MDRRARVQQALPGVVLAVVVLAEFLTGRGQVVLTLTVMAPLLAATVLGRRATVAYGVLAFFAGLLLGVYEQQYTADTAVAQIVRLVALVLAGALALAVCEGRLRHEAQLARLSADAAASRAAVRTSEALQRALLGAPPRVPGLEIAARYLPGERSAHVGGDWYDAFPLPDGCTMLVIGDVAGHDAPAAAAMAQARGMLRALARAGHTSPADALTALDDVLAGLGLETLITVTVVVVDTREDGGSVPFRWSNAGHPPAVLVRTDGMAELLARAPDRLLGTMTMTTARPRTEHEVRLDRGDLLVLYTDGLVERRGMTLDDGTGWLLRALSGSGGEQLDRVCDGLLGALGARGDDDIALLAVRLPR